MTSITATRLALQELRYKQHSLELDVLRIQRQRKLASILNRRRLEQAEREQLRFHEFFEQMALEALEEAALEAPDQAARETLEQAARERLEQAEREQLELLEQAEREQHELLEQAGREQLGYERIARLWHSLESLALLLLSILRFLLGCSKFGGFQNRQRPKCTTMPWNIWPSLVVLWGVCWMFVNTPFVEFDATQFNSAFDDEQLPLFVPNHSLDQPSVANPGDFDQFWGNFEFENALNDAPYPDDPYVDHQIFNDISLGSLQQKDQDQTSAMEVVNRLTYSGSPLGGSSSNLDNGFKEPATPDLPIMQLHTNVGQVSNSHINNHALAPLPAAETMFNRSPNSKTPLLQQTSTVSKQRQDPPRNAEGNLICNNHECSDKVFRRYCDWQTHINKHQRPFRCSINGCPRSTSGFATKGVLDRHVFRVHQSSHSAGSGNVKSIGAEVAGGDLATMAQSFPTSEHGKRKYLPSDDLIDQGTNEADRQDDMAENVPKRLKVVIQDHDEMAHTTPSIKDLIKENEILQQQLGKAREDLDRCRKEREKEREKMLGIIDQLAKRGTE